MPEDMGDVGEDRGTGRCAEERLSEGSLRGDATINHQLLIALFVQFFDVKYRQENIPYLTNSLINPGTVIIKAKVGLQSP